VTADLGSPDGVAVVRDLLSTADVLIENFRPGLMARFGLALDDLREAHPRLVTCSLTAFGADAVETASRPGYDISVQAMSGLMSVTGERDGEPTKAGVALLDVISGLYAAVGVLAALRERDVAGHGRHVSVSLFDASVAAMVNQAANYLIGGVVPQRMGTEHPNIVPYQSFHAKDRPFILAAGNDRLFARTCGVVGHPEWADDPRFATNESRVLHREELIPMLEDTFARRRMQDWLALLEEAGVPCAPIMAMDEVFASPDGAGLIQLVDDPVRGPLRTANRSVRRDGDRNADAAAAAGRTRRRGPTRSRRRHGRVTTADRWREQLAAWAIPEDILANAPESLGFATECFRRRGRRRPLPRRHPPRRALEALRGRHRDRHRRRRRRHIAAAGGPGRMHPGDRPQADMLDGFLANAAAAGVEVRGVMGTWPETPGGRPADVVVAGHVSTTSRDRAVRSSGGYPRAPSVVLELTAKHPLDWMRDLGSDSTSSNGPWGQPRRTRVPSSASWVPGGAGGPCGGRGTVSGASDAARTRSIRSASAVPASRHDAEIADALGDGSEVRRCGTSVRWSGPSSRSGGIRTGSPPGMDRTVSWNPVDQK
jgi:crotonobetainyl-CoA:carnitine CoA-transferase CaiB-like acyl-CoA transferase